MDIAQTRRCDLAMHRPNLDVSYRFDDIVREGTPMGRRRRSKAPESRVDEAWVIFRLSTTPISTTQDGDFHCVALMDMASGFLIGMQMVPLWTKDELGAAAPALLNVRGPRSRGDRPRHAGKRALRDGRRARRSDGNDGG